MTILLIDMGNSRLKWATLSPGEKLGGGRYEFQAGGAVVYNVGAWAAAFEGAWATLSDVREVWVACVAGREAVTALGEWVKARWSASYHVLHASAELAGVRNAYREPQRLGADRWAALIGARAIVEGAVYVIDCGTAITVDVLDVAGQHQGGLIVPGLAMMRRSLLSRTAEIRQGLARDEGADDKLWQACAPGWGSDTGECVRNGTFQVLTGWLEQLRIRAVQQDRATLLFSGGDAPALMAGLTQSTLHGEVMRHVPDLVLHGLARVVEETL